MSESLGPFLQPTFFIDSQHVRICDAVSRLRSKDDSPKTLAMKLFAFVRDQIHYDAFCPMRRRNDNVASVILERKRGFCVQKAVVLAALCRNAGIPCKLCFADVENHIMSKALWDLMRTRLFTYHGYNAIWLAGRWVKATPAFDRELCERQGFILGEFDGETDLLLPARDRQGRTHIEYKRQIGCTDDLPLEEIMKAFHETYVKDNPLAESLWEGDWGGMQI